jgi:hypothetical protein
LLQKYHLDTEDGPLDIHSVGWQLWHITIPPNLKWHYPCQEAAQLGTGTMEVFAVMDYRPIVVTLGSTGRVVGKYRIFPDSHIPPAECLGGESSILMHEYFGDQIPSDLMYLWWDDELAPASFGDPLYQLIEARCRYYPLLVVGPNFRKCLVVDQNNHAQRVAISNYDTYDRFVNHGVSQMYCVDPSSIEISICGNIIFPTNEDSSPTLLLDALNYMSPERSFIPTITISVNENTTHASPH